MLSFEKCKWSDIKPAYNSIIVGNGLSISIANDFRYGTLFNHAVELGWIDEDAKSLFEYLKTENFEEALRALSESNDVLKIMTKSENIKLKDAHDKIRQSLINSIGGLHKNYHSVEHSIKKLALKIKEFDYVFSLNYDLLMYWAVIESNKSSKNSVKDCFFPTGFPSDWKKYKTPYPGNTKSTLIFYPHGNMSIIKKGNTEIKAKAEVDHLLSVISGHISNDEKPIFISEGTSARKLQSIAGSQYLSKVYFECMGEIGDNVAIHGWSMSENDKHLIDRVLMSNKLRKVALGVNGLDDRKTKEWERKLDKLFHNYEPDVKVQFYEASEFMK
ncbi:DUF4917 family protein [Chromobacterium amazonense]|uniref:DUF4917 family protein n=1 Tax=Chromobacterium amazonense TaxID=1382803 RepID=A0ABU8UYY1_9NEIS|nr:DUF4917 family protein [Chromobacterium amazonense]MDQ4539874.1 DUF4917 family protein [Chromobacterium amazonense]